MKKILVLSAFLMSNVVVANVASAAVANTPLSQKIVKLIDAENYTLRFCHKQSAPDYEKQIAQQYGYDAQKQGVHTYQTIVRNGENLLYITESFANVNDKFQSALAFGIKNGATYWYKGMVKGYPQNSITSVNDLSKAVNKFTPYKFDKFMLNYMYADNGYSSPDEMVGKELHYVQRLALMSKAPFEDFFANFMDKDKRTKNIKAALSAATLEMVKQHGSDASNLRANALADICTVYNGGGKQAIDGVNYDFEEYVTPKDAHLPSVCRYYFLDGNLVKAVKINSGLKEDFLLPAGLNYNGKSYEVMEITEFKDEATNVFFDMMK